MAQALEDFVIKKASSAINDLVEESLDKTQLELKAELSADGPQKIQELALRCKKKQEELALQGQRKVKRATTFGADSDEDNSDVDEMKTAKGRGKSTAKSTGESVNKRELAVVSGRGRGRGRGRSISSGAETKLSKQVTKPHKKKKDEYSEDLSDDDEDDVDEDISDDDDFSDMSGPHTKRKAVSAVPSAASRILPSRATKARSSNYIEADSEDEDVVEVQEVPTPVRAGWPVETKQKNSIPEGSAVIGAGGGSRKRPMPFDNKHRSSEAASSKKNGGATSSFTENWD